MERSLLELEAIVRNRICGICSDRTVEGKCGLDEPSECALFSLFPQVAQAIQSTSSDDIRDYIEAIRANVCKVCAHVEGDASCDVRRQVRCALDAYLPLVVDAIEEATGRQFSHSAVRSSGTLPE